MPIRIGSGQQVMALESAHTLGEDSEKVQHITIIGPRYVCIRIVGVSRCAYRGCRQGMFMQVAVIRETQGTGRSLNKLKMKWKLKELADYEYDEDNRTTYI